MENRPKMRKGPSFPGLGREIFPVVPGTLERSLYTFLMPNLPLLPQTFSNKIEENCTFGLILHCSPPPLGSPSPKLGAKFAFLLYHPIGLGVNLD